LVFKKSYETNSIWQFKSIDWKIISEWARHNTLSKNIWKTKEIPATWFYVDTKVLIEMLMEYWVKIRNKDDIDLSFVQLWDEAKRVVLPLSLQAREAGITTVVSLWTPSMREQMLNAQRLKAKYIVMVWLVEARNWIFQVRNEADWTQEEVKKEDLINYIIDKIGKENLDFYAPEDDFIIK
jgi:histidyl-tRNA synthetase